MLEGGLPVSDSNNAAHSKNVRFTYNHRTQPGINRLAAGESPSFIDRSVARLAAPLEFHPLNFLCEGTSVTNFSI